MLPNEVTREDGASQSLAPKWLFIATELLGAIGAQWLVVQTRFIAVHYMVLTYWVLRLVCVCFGASTGQKAYSENSMVFAWWTYMLEVKLLASELLIAIDIWYLKGA